MLQPSMVGVQTMLAAKLGRHKSALDKFQGMREGARQELEAAIAAAAAGGDHARLPLQ